MKILVYITLAAVLLVSCKIKRPAVIEARHHTIDSIRHKPAAWFQDTLEVKGPVVVFYEPDSAQIRKIREVTQPWIFEGSMHDYLFQFRNAHIVLNRDWKHLKNVTARNVRFLRFRYANGTTELVDLDQHSDAFGIFAFDGRQRPTPIEMTNFENLIPAYFQQ